MEQIGPVKSRGDAKATPAATGLRRLVAVNLDMSSPWEEWVQLAELYPVLDLAVEVRAESLPPSEEALLRAEERLRSLKGKSCLHILGEMALPRLLKGDFDSLLAHARVLLLDCPLSEGEARQAKLKCRQLVCECAQLSLLDEGGPSVEGTSWIQPLPEETREGSSSVPMVKQGAGRAFRLAWSPGDTDSDMKRLAILADGSTVVLVQTDGRRTSIDDCYGIARAFARVRSTPERIAGKRSAARVQIARP